MTILAIDRPCLQSNRFLRLALIACLIVILALQAPVDAIAESAKPEAPKTGAGTTPRKKTNGAAKTNGGKTTPKTTTPKTTTPKATTKSTAKSTTSKTAGGKTTGAKSTGTVRKSAGGAKPTAKTSTRRNSSVRKKTTRNRSTAVRGARTGKVPAPVTVIKAPGLKLTGTARPTKSTTPKTAHLSTVKGAADSTRIMIGGQPHDSRYALFVMPGQEISIEAHVAGGLAQKWEGDGSFDPLPSGVPFATASAAPSPQARATAARTRVHPPGRSLTWRAPEVAGAAFLTLKGAAPAAPGTAATWKDIARLNIMVMMPAEQMIAGRINGYLIGAYPAPRTMEDSTYLPPIAFLKATGGPTPISPNFFLEDFACKQQHDGERFVALQPRLLPFLEAISARVDDLTSLPQARAIGPAPTPRALPGNASGVQHKDHEADESDEPTPIATATAQAVAQPRRPILPNTPAPPPSFRSSPGDAMEAAASRRTPFPDMAEVVRERPIKVLSGYRTPAYNRTLRTAKLSRHQYGDACDIYVDRDNDGRMDDLNFDGSIDGRDAITLAAWIEDLWQAPEFRHCPGGLGIYNGNGSHGPFVHVDLRGSKARWGGNGLRWDDESESARELLGQADPYGAFPGHDVLAAEASNLAHEESETVR